MRYSLHVLIGISILAFSGCQSPTQQIKRTENLDAVKNKIEVSFKREADSIASYQTDAFGEILTQGVENLNSKLSGPFDSWSQNYNVPIWVKRYVILPSDIDFMATSYEAQIKVALLAAIAEECSKAEDLNSAQYLASVVSDLPEIQPQKADAIYGKVVESFWAVERTRSVGSRIFGDKSFAQQAIPESKSNFADYLRSSYRVYFTAVDGHITKRVDLKTHDACLKEISAKLSRAQIVLGALEQAGVFNATYVTCGRVEEYRECFIGMYDTPRMQFRSDAEKEKFEREKFSENVYDDSDFELYKHAVAISSQRAYNATYNDYTAMCDSAMAYSGTRRMGTMREPSSHGVGADTSGSDVSSKERVGDFVDAGFIVADSTLVTVGLVGGPETGGFSLVAAGAIISVLEGGKWVWDTTAAPQVAASKVADMTNDLRGKLWRDMLFGKPGVPVSYFNDAFAASDQLWSGKL